MTNMVSEKSHWCGAVIFSLFNMKINHAVTVQCSASEGKSFFSSFLLSLTLPVSVSLRIML